MRLSTRTFWSASTALIIGCGLAHDANATEDIFPPLTAQTFVGRWEAIAPSTDSYFILTREADRSTLVLTVGSKAHAFVATGPVTVDSSGKFRIGFSVVQSHWPLKNVEITGEGIAEGETGGGIATVRVSFPGTSRSWTDVVFKRVTRSETGVDRLCDAIDMARSMDAELQKQD